LKKKKQTATAWQSILQEIKTCNEANHNQHGELPGLMLLLMDHFKEDVDSLFILRPVSAIRTRPPAHHYMLTFHSYRNWKARTILNAHVTWSHVTLAWLSVVGFNPQRLSRYMYHVLTVLYISGESIIQGTSFHVYVEKRLCVRPETFLDALGCLMAAYFDFSMLYPVAAVATIDFIQRYVDVPLGGRHLPCIEVYCLLFLLSAYWLCIK
jgi:hypothetical protein